MKFIGPLISVLGSEGAGIPLYLLTCVPERVFVDSLNVSIAAGIIIYKLHMFLIKKFLTIMIVSSLKNT